MTGKEIKDIIAKELEGQSELTNAHGLNIGNSLIDPVKEFYCDMLDESVIKELWTVLEELPDRSGYKITFNETEKTFGLGIMTDKDQLMDIGNYGTFLKAFRGM